MRLSELFEDLIVLNFSAEYTNGKVKALRNCSRQELIEHANEIATKRGGLHKVAYRGVVVADDFYLSDAYEITHNNMLRAITGTNLDDYPGDSKFFIGIDVKRDKIDYMPWDRKMDARAGCPRLQQLMRPALKEGQPLRQTDPKVAEWIEAARARPDADQLFLHGSNEDFLDFHQPNIDQGQLIFFSPLKDAYGRTGALQAEYYGRRLYLAKLAKGNRFNPYGDPKAKALYEKALPPDTWDRANKIKYGRLDYQDLHHVVPMAVAAGYDRFYVYEVSMQSESHAVARPDMITVVDRYP